MYVTVKNAFSINVVTKPWKAALHVSPSFAEMSRSLQQSFYCNTLDLLFFLSEYFIDISGINQNEHASAALIRDSFSVCFRCTFVVENGWKKKKKNPQSSVSLKLLPLLDFYLLSVKRASLLPTRSQHVFPDLFVGLLWTFIPRSLSEPGLSRCELPPLGGTVALHAERRGTTLGIVGPLLVYSVFLFIRAPRVTAKGGKRLPC